jgi:hypothetical protein
MVEMMRYLIRFSTTCLRIGKVLPSQILLGPIIGLTVGFASRRSMGNKMAANLGSGPLFHFISISDLSTSLILDYYHFPYIISQQDCVHS